MSRVHLVILWHMHQPLYRDPATGQYVMPWTRLHALKDYWGMVKILEEFPGVHVTFNVVPSMGAQIEEYASDKAQAPWFQLAFQPADALNEQERVQLLENAFQVNRDNLMSRWPRYVELYQRAHEAGLAAAAEEFGPRDWLDLQVLSQLAWTDEEYLAHDPVVAKLARKGGNFTEKDKQNLRQKQMELLGIVLPEYRRAMERGQIEVSTTPFYHPILPLLCDTEIAREANPHTPPLQPAFRYPEDAREQLARARRYHERVFGRPPVGLWPSEGSVSDQALDLASELGFRWFASDEGVLGRTLSVGFARDAAGVPGNAERLYAPLRVRRGGREIVGIFRDHYLSDLIGFVYNRMDQTAAAEDLHRRLRTIGERVRPEAVGGRPLTVALILDGENAWEYFPGNGRHFLREFYRRMENDPEIRALTASEAIAQAGEIASVEHIAPGSWINANFDVWIGHAEDVRAWELLREARQFYARAVKARAEGQAGAPSEEQLIRAYESVLAAEGSDWCWWYGPEHSSANDAQFDALYRTHLTEIYVALGAEAPETLAQPIKRKPERAVVAPPSAYLRVRVDGRETSYFEWMGAGLYSADRRSGAMHGRAHFLHELHYGFDEKNFYVRVDPFAEALDELQDCEFRISIRAQHELRISAHIEAGKLVEHAVEQDDVCMTEAGKQVAMAFSRILEVRIPRDLLAFDGKTSFTVGVALWEGGLPVDVLPAEGFLEVKLGADAFAWADA